jgi:hypothetical protein
MVLNDDTDSQRLWMQLSMLWDAAAVRYYSTKYAAVVVVIVVIEFESIVLLVIHEVTGVW